MRVTLLWATLLMAALLLPTLPQAKEPFLPERAPAVVLRIIDGDTIAVEAVVWPGVFIRVHVRLRGVDAPELRGAERAAGLVAKAALAEVFPPGAPVWIVSPRNGKYAGRVVAEVVARE